MPDLKLSFNLDPVKTSSIYVPDDPEYMIDSNKKKKASISKFKLTPKQQHMKHQFLGLICKLKKQGITVRDGDGGKIIDACLDYFTERGMEVNEYQLERGY